MRANTLSRCRALLVGGAALALGLVSANSFAAATIVIQNGNAAGVGFNDPTPAVPVGGNPGTTLGQQRLNAFQAAANIWGATLDSNVTIIVFATMEPLTCTATSATLGSAGPRSVWRDFTGAPFGATWYHAALANKLFNADLDSGTDYDIRARFNSNLGQTGCLTGSPFYLGLDNNHGPLIDLETVLLHEFGHGLGFSTTTSGLSGQQLNDGTNATGYPSSYDHFLLDNTTNKLWINMTPAERQVSALNTQRVVWIGGNVVGASGLLSPGTPQMKGLQPAAIVGTYLVGTASFGPPLSDPGLTGEVMPVVDQPNGTGLACTPLNALNAAAVNGKIALVDRGVCVFVDKVKNAQAAGAIAVIVADNAAGSPPAGLAGTDPAVVIPSVRITLADGNTLKSALKFRSRTKSGVFVNLGVDPTVRAGADAAGHVMVFTPNPFQSGSSVSHWDVSAFPNLLMEPAINGDLTHSVLPPQDLSFPMLRDIGW
ncbi:MAG TPA: PA domain-containing protein [Povalibacter sp.]|nr:PA domain-containing protein [Povalibacter sp.]